MTAMNQPSQNTFLDDLESYVYQQCIFTVDKLPESYFKDLIIEKTISNMSFTVKVQEVHTAKLIPHKALLLVYNVLEFLHRLSQNG